MFSFENIYKAYNSCLKHKGNTLNALNFQANLLENLYDLEYELKTKRYTIGKSICFLASSPKLREIFAADFKDRIVHHILVNSIEDFYEKKFIFDVYNNRKNKGIHIAVKRVKQFMQNSKNQYFLQLDIKGFFYNLDKNILFKKLCLDITKSNLTNKDKILYLCYKIIYHNPTQKFTFKGDIRKLKNLPAHKTLFKIPTNKGLAIGNLTSQFFANVYLNSFDHFIKRELKVKAYLRYVDDFILFGSSKDELLEKKQKIEYFLNTKLKLKLREDYSLEHISNGANFLGYIIRKNYILTRKRVVNNYKYKKALFLSAYEKSKGEMSLEEIKKFLCVQASFKGHIKHSNAYKLNKQIGEINDEKYINMFDIINT